MLYLVFEVGPHRYALEARSVVEVLPMVGITPVPLAAGGLAGVFLYRGASVPAFDLGLRWSGRQTPRANARLILVERPDTGGAGGVRLAGLVAEFATETLRRDPAAFIPSGAGDAAGTGTDQVTTDSHGVIHLISPDTLLPAALQADHHGAGAR